jgi:NADPH-dependent 2,4-dienoyl-CoA reductase/sulfur reductase-like enzyme
VAHHRAGDVVVHANAAARAELAGGHAAATRQRRWPRALLAVVTKRGILRRAIRAERVRAGRIAGGACYGYTLERKTDPSGRRYTIAVVNETEAVIVRRIFDEYLDGRGLRAIAHQLNLEGRADPFGRTSR